MKHLREIARMVSARIGAAETSHDKHWRQHPAVATDDALTFGQRAADVMKGIFSTWAALLTILAAMAAWISTGGFGHDGAPFILLNLCLSCLAACQCFVLLIAAKRADQVTAAVALHTLDNTRDLKALLQQNTELTQRVMDLTELIHEHITREQPVPRRVSPVVRTPKSVH